jgi:hypothetical protein
MDPDKLMPKRRPPLQPVPMGLFYDPEAVEL